MNYDYENYKDLLFAYKALEKENDALRTENAKLRQQLDLPLQLYDSCGQSIPIKISDSAPSPRINNNSSPAEKITLFMSLFKGREDVYARRWYSGATKKSGYQPVCEHEWLPNLCDKKRYRCARCPNRKFSSLNESAIEAHLKGAHSQGKDVLGVYPLLKDENCHFLAIDFDDTGWQKDIAAFRLACLNADISISVERSRSGEGAHVWIFFEEPIPAAMARKLGSALLTSAMNSHHEISFRSYDRLFPSQDLMPTGGFGNLIALPLQGQARKCGNSVFIDQNFIPYPDQWAYLSAIKKISAAKVQEKIGALSKNDELGILVEAEEETKPWEKRKPGLTLGKADFPDTVDIVKANMLYLEKTGLSQKVLTRIKRLAAFKNPEFYKSQALRLPTYDKPRIIFTLDETEKYLGIPRGCEDELKRLLDEANVTYRLDDKTNPGKPIKVKFSGQLNADQKPAARALLKYDLGVLSATTAFGKTVIAAGLIARRKTNTLILVHTQALLMQWQKTLLRFLVINEPMPKPPLQKRGRKKKRSIIGQLGGGKNTLSGIVDIAIMQSVINGQGVKDLVKDYGLVIVDECHHVPAYSFEKILKAVMAKHVYGLTATPARQDGHHPIIFMQCGPIRYKVDAKAQADKRPFDHFIIPKFTSFKKPLSQDEKDWPITQIYSLIADDELRNRQIVDDIQKCVAAGRTPLVLTERAEHVKTLAEKLRQGGANVFSLIGSAKQKEKREMMQKLDSLSQEAPLVIVATGKYVGEGFDYPRLDTLFLVMPIAWRGTIAQYAGRLHRLYETKKEVLIYDYIDIHVPMLERMYHKRVKGYAQIGYKAKPENTQLEKTNTIFDGKSFLGVFCNDLEMANKGIIMVSPFMRKKRLAQMLHFLSPKITNNVNITVVTRQPQDFRAENRQAFEDHVEQLKRFGIKVIHKPMIHQKFTIIDQHIVWFGSVNFLSFGSSEESIMRLNSYEIASELLGTLEPCPI
ncbi:helicase [candidate division WOR-1 bacterium RIFOXYB2_FULL_42_35]|uniref:Helicase n=1 Tax=candidate division WOR-1 bacterium RIFOXYC2_FULL_41_25 TaxID=1802586 RepID=A0A1F4TQI0_UNCSA|nr:MAG: helicase [candidate division WOR-1 bacterium RIFOXYA2_FULL_41_14]OGC25433.1 MAG: helicase [candidate division WOR-1 bacterium RIFOXYB2_FULL_42_35]OGC34839.1 MAG: helicase [candidate division WOR-1 bacterium RIFOXYC2_FULL_41_25]OGC42672.1 MAG: helicase [candidate division WOR-1 bacterium RIFOXYD2_FULL_41_8]